MHMVLLVAVHVFCFWFIPITGNQKLYGSPECNLAQQKYYGCKNFHANTALKAFYLIACLYLLLSALQLRHGFPIQKVASSVLAVNESAVAVILA
jgi:hypothetical protein